MKKKIAVYSNSSLAKTGFGKHARILLQYLVKNGYDAFEMAAGYGENNPQLKMLPWRAYGLTPETPAEVNRINAIVQQNPGMATAVGYGNFGIEKVILKEKPDVIIAIEDSWAWPGLLGRAIFRKNPENWIFWCPQDSLPLLEGQKQFARGVRHFAVKAPFAKDAFEAEGIKTMYWKALSDFSKFYPNRAGGLQLRRESGISDDTLCFGFVFRNQLRKLVYPLIEGFRDFREKNPNSRLVLHTHPCEGPSTWNIPEIMRLSGVPYESVLFTRFCPNCRRLSLGPEIRGKEPCSCGGELVHPKVDVGISEEQLNLVYNAFDGYIHPANSGGAEFPVAEAIHAGVPAATVDYAYGTMYTSTGLVDALPFNWYERHEDLFKKARPTPEGIAAFMQKIADMTPQERAERGRKAREWAVEYFDTQTTCDTVRGYIEALPPAQYDWSFPCLMADMPMDEAPDAWARELYFNFFGDHAPDSFVQSVVQHINNGASRGDLYKKTQELAKQNTTPFNPKALFKENGKKRLLIGMEHGVAECFILLSVLDQLREKYSADEWSIYVMTAPENTHVFEHLDYLDGILPAHEMVNTYYYEGSGMFERLVDIYLQPFKATHAQWGWTHNGFTL